MFVRLARKLPTTSVFVVSVFSSLMNWVKLAKFLCKETRMPSHPMPSPRRANITFGCVLKKASAFFRISSAVPLVAPDLILKKVNATSSSPIFENSGIAAYSLIK